MYKAPHILVFDSGAGGLDIAREILDTSPGVLLSYLADNDAFPYGLKPREFLQNHIIALMGDFIQRLKPDIVVLACNTASTAVLKPLRSLYTCPFVGVVPAIKPAAAASKSGAMGVLATPETVERDYTKDLIREFAPERQVFLHGSDALVQLAETFLHTGDIDTNILESELLCLFQKEKQKKIDTVVLGCTHFTLIKAHLISSCPRKIHWIDSSVAVAKRVQYWLEKSPLYPNQCKSQDRPNAQIEIYLTNENKAEHTKTLFDHYLRDRQTPLPG